MDQSNNNFIINGFSKWDIKKKLDFISKQSGIDIQVLKSYSWQDDEVSTIINKLSENTIAHFPLPYGLAPNFKILDKNYVLPLVTEESSVVAALANAAKTWYNKGGFKYEVLGTVKKGQIHFFWEGQKHLIINSFPKIKPILLDSAREITAKMEKRGGGILGIELLDKTKELPNYYQLDVSFDTLDAMGANFINSVLEEMAKALKKLMTEHFPNEVPVEIVMSILSNYTPECLVKAWVECPINELDELAKGMSGKEYAAKFEKAIKISHVDVSRAVTHNKGIFNGIDSLALATGNDWRAIESAGHAYASRNGVYKGLTNVSLYDGKFNFSIKIPMNVGVVGGVTALHPMTALSMKILQEPSAKELMGFFAIAGLASNFAAITALIGKGIQQGHMKMHLKNILFQLGASEFQTEQAQDYFKGKTITFAAVEKYISEFK